MESKKEIIKVKMLKTLQGVDVGEVYPKFYKKDEVHNIGESLFKAFKDLGGVEIVKEEAPKAPEKPEGSKEINLNSLTKPKLVEFAEKECNLILDVESLKSELIKSIEDKLKDTVN